MGAPAAAARWSDDGERGGECPRVKVCQRLYQESHQPCGHPHHWSYRRAVAGGSGDLYFVARPEGYGGGGFGQWGHGKEGHGHGEVGDDGEHREYEELEYTFDDGGGGHWVGRHEYGGHGHGQGEEHAEEHGHGGDYSGHWGGGHDEGGSFFHSGEHHYCPDWGGEPAGQDVFGGFLYYRFVAKHGGRYKSSAQKHGYVWFDKHHGEGVWWKGPQWRLLWHGRIPLQGRSLQKLSCRFHHHHGFKEVFVCAKRKCIHVKKCD